MFYVPNLSTKAPLRSLYISIQYLGYLQITNTTRRHFEQEILLFCEEAPS